MDIHSMPSRKRMRKGTRCCLNCRKRKVRCVHTGNPSEICDGCKAKNLECIDQEYGISRLELKQKTREKMKTDVELNGLIGEVLQHLAVRSDDAGRTKAEDIARDSLTRLRSYLLLPAMISSTDGHTIIDQDESFAGQRQRLNQAPLVSLLNNDIFGSYAENGSTLDILDAPEARTPATGSDTFRKTQILRAMVPHPHDVSMVLSSNRSGWRIWQRAFPMQVSTHGRSSTNDRIRDIVLLRDLQVLPTEDLAIIAKIMLCFALSVQTLPTDFDFTLTQLPVGSDKLQARYLTPIEDIIALDADYFCNLDGLDCMLLQKRLYVNIGKPHKAWTIARRAITISHLLGLHREDVGFDDPISRRKRRLWQNVWQGERYLSLILGLPYAASDPKFEQLEAAGIANGESLLRQINVLTGKIIDRDQGHGKLHFTATIQIDQQMDECRQLMPKSWWEAPLDPTMSIEALTDMLVLKFSYQNIRKLLHLPFMLQASKDPRYEFNRVAALDASRELIKYYKMMRNPETPVLQVCNLADFQAFTAAMVLVLDLLVYSVPYSPQAVDKQRADWEIIQDLTRVLRRVALESQQNVAHQAAKVLEDVSNTYLNPSLSQGFYQVNIPYFGKLTLKSRNAHPPFADLSPKPLSVEPHVSQPMYMNDNANVSSEDSLISFQSAIPLQDGQLWPEGAIDWNAMIDFDLCDAWGSTINSDLIGYPSHDLEHDHAVIEPQ